MEDSSVLQTPVKRCKNKAQFLFSGLVTSNHRMTSATSEACKSTKRSPRNEGASNSGAENTGTGEGHHTPMCQDRGGRGGDGDRLRADCKRSGGVHTQEPLTYRPETFKLSPAESQGLTPARPPGRWQSGRMESGVLASTGLHIMLLMSPSPGGSSPAHQHFENHLGR